nr:MAG TPA: hypothetical protein [Caudoviricetes sp.]
MISGAKRLRTAALLAAVVTILDHISILLVRVCEIFIHFEFKEELAVFLKESNESSSLEVRIEPLLQARHVSLTNGYKQFERGQEIGLVEFVYNECKLFDDVFGDSIVLHNNRLIHGELLGHDVRVDISHEYMSPYLIILLKLVVYAGEVDGTEQNGTLPFETVTNRVFAHPLEDMLIHSGLKHEVHWVPIRSIRRLEHSLIPAIDIPQDGIRLDPKSISIEPLWAHLDIERGVYGLTSIWVFPVKVGEHGILAHLTFDDIDLPIRPVCIPFRPQPSNKLDIRIIRHLHVELPSLTLCSGVSLPAPCRTEE